MSRRLSSWRRRAALLGLRHEAVKIHGQQRAGTNFVGSLVKANAPKALLPWPDEGGWKHGPFEPHRRWKYLVVARHPLAWIESLHDWEVKHGRSTAPSLSAFLREPTVDPRLAQVWGADQPWDVYTAAYSAWLDSSLITALVRYDDLVREPGRATDRLFAELDLPRPALALDVLERADVWQTQIERRPLDRRRSLDGWQDVVEPGDVDFVRSRIPTSLLERLGYSI